MDVHSVYIVQRTFSFLLVISRRFFFFIINEGMLYYLFYEILEYGLFPNGAVYK